MTKELIFFQGTMDSGKSDILIKTAHGYDSRGRNLLTTKPAKDTKGGPNITSRTGFSRETDFVLEANDDIRRIVQAFLAMKAIHYLFIDEAQFLEPHHVDQLARLAKQDEVEVRAYGLKSDFRTKLFPGSKRLIELADVVKELETICECGENAQFNTRKVNGLYVFEGEQVAIDGVDEVTYDVLCGSCYYEAQDKVQNLQ